MSDIIIKYLSFSGGGVKGLAYSGVLQYFEETNITLNNLIAVSGSSIGAVIALCVALKFSSSELANLFNKYDIYNFVSFKNILYYIPNLYYNYGFLGTEELDKIICDILDTKNIPVDISFQGLFDLTNIHLIITTTNLNLQLTEFCDYKNTPNMSVKTACVVSASFPVVFKSTIIDGNYYCDGGTFANFPFKYPGMLEEHCYGFILNSNNISIHNLFDYIESLVGGLCKNASDEYYISDGKESEFVINIDIDNISTFCSLTNEQKTYLIQQGYECTKKYFET